MLTHLILNDYLKLKSEVSVFVNLLLCENQTIVENVKLFFREVSNKNPEFINNTFPEVVHRLSKEENDGGISEICFEKISNEILSFVEKDKSLEDLADSLMINLRNTTNEKEVRNILMCLNHLMKSEKVIQNIVSQGEIFKLKIEIPNADTIIHLMLKKIKRNNKV